MAIDLRKRNKASRVETAVKTASSGKKKKGQTPQAAPNKGAERGERPSVKAADKGRGSGQSGRSAANAGQTGRDSGGRTERNAANAGQTGRSGGGRQERGAANTGKPAAKNGAGKGGDFLEIIPLGGLGEIGKNMTALRYGGEIMIVDCGMSFPEDEMFGIDVVIPEFEFLEENKAQIKGIIVTHGHEDHIGAIPYLLKRFRLPVYGTRLTLGLITSKLTEHGIQGDLHTIEAGDSVKIGRFRTETIRVTHSIADALALVIETPAGTVFHTGDFKIDYTPIDGAPMDFQRIAEIGKKGVDIMLCDSTNALRKGFTESEKTMGPILEKIFADTNGRIIIATFASNVHRVQTIINTAVKNKRKIALSGRSMLKVMELAKDLGYLDVPAGAMVDLNEIKNIPDKKLVIITTGSQGEPMSALTRMASNDHRSVCIKKGDRVILSSSPIPGNEKTVSGIVNSLLAKGADVIYSDIADIHVSGHASQEEIKLMISLIRPKYYMPVHGENKHLLQNAALAENLGIPKGNIIAAKNGSVIEMRGGKAALTDRTVSAEPVFVDGLGVGDIGTSVLKDRKLLSESGLIIVVAAIDSASGMVVSGPDVFSRGFVYEKASGDIIEELRQAASQKLESYERSGSTDWEAMKGAVRNSLRGLIFERTKRSPVILTIIMEA